ncbi:hypothetical protein ACE10Z_06075 [Bradyrhizobium sp. Pha-3]|uniref:hypothetical protein n=1 Tax=Bradyrhizobium sp. Pha-3 TaxID=208375 RepID=UPI0035D44F57
MQRKPQPVAVRIQRVAKPALAGFGFFNPGRLMVKHLISDEEKCDACKGTGFPEVKQPGEPGRKIYPEPCKQCGGKGRIRKATWGK